MDVENFGRTVIEQVLPKVIWESRVAKSPLVTKGHPKFTPNCPDYDPI